MTVICVQAADPGLLESDLPQRDEAGSRRAECHVCGDRSCLVECEKAELFQRRLRRT